MQYRVDRNIPTIAIFLGVFTVTSMALMASTNRAYSNLHAALDMGMLLIAAILGLLYWDKIRRGDGKIMSAIDSTSQMLWRTSLHYTSRTSVGTAEQQFVGDKLLVAIQDGLAGQNEVLTERG